MSTAIADVLVLGLGAMGSATAYHLAKRGANVIGIEQFEPGHARGASHGRSRIIREAYAEGAQYVEFVQRAFVLWDELAHETGAQFLDLCGALYFGPPGGPVVEGTLESARIHKLAVDALDGEALMRRFPEFRVPAHFLGAWEKRAGLLRPEIANAAHQRRARELGADLRFGDRVIEWSADSGGVQLRTNTGAYTAKTLLITAGPWAGKVLRDLPLRLSVHRMANVHFAAVSGEEFGPRNLPVFYFDTGDGEYFGIAGGGGEGVKFGRHDILGLHDPDDVAPPVTGAETSALRSKLAEFLPRAAGNPLWSVTCLYTHSPDRHFLIDRHPRHENVWLACGFSGHGYKFASAVGETMAGYALDGHPPLPMDFFSLKRIEGSA